MVFRIVYEQFTQPLKGRLPRGLTTREVSLAAKAVAAVANLKID